MGPDNPQSPKPLLRSEPPMPLAEANKRSEAMKRVHDMKRKRAAEQNWSVTLTDMTPWAPPAHMAPVHLNLSGPNGLHEHSEHQTPRAALEYLHARLGEILYPSATVTRMK